MKTLQCNKEKIVFLIFIFTSAFTSAQQLQWAKQIGGKRLDFSANIKNDNQNNVYTTGAFLDTVDFDPGGGVFNINSSDTVHPGSSFILKLDSGGNFVWAKAWLTNPTDGFFIKGFAVDSKCNIYVGGSFYNTIDFDPGPGTHFLNSNANDDAFIMKLDSSGNFIWALSFGSTNSDFVYSIEIDSAFNIYSAGYFSDLVDFDPGPGFYNISCNGLHDMFILKLDSTGNFIWVRTFGGISEEFARSIKLDYDNHLVITGRIYGQVDFDSSASSNIQGASNRPSAFLLKTDTAGTIIYVCSWLAVQGLDLDVDNNNNVYLTGNYLGQTDMDPGPGVANVYPHDNFGGDLYVSSFDENGLFRWTYGIGGPYNDWGAAIKVDQNNKVYATGIFSDSVDFDPGPGVNKLYASGWDPYILEFDPVGALINVGQFPSTSSDQPSAMSIDNSGAIFITGTFQDTIDCDPTANSYYLYASQPRPNAGDVFIIKLDYSIINNASGSEHELQALIHPNPVTTTALISFENQLHQNVTLTIYDVMGRFIETHQSSSHEFVFEKGNNKPGIYFFELRGGKTNYAAKGKFIITE